MALTSVLHEDGTWTATGNMAENEFTSNSTWTPDGTKLQLTTTEQDGKRETKPETRPATLEGGIQRGVGDKDKKACVSQKTKSLLDELSDTEAGTTRRGAPVVRLTYAAAAGGAHETRTRVLSNLAPIV